MNLASSFVLSCRDPIYKTEFSKIQPISSGLKGVKWG